MSSIEAWWWHRLASTKSVTAASTAGSAARASPVRREIAVDEQASPVSQFLQP
jgi:hypothetical protein